MFEDGRCPNCGTALPGGAKYCAKCGYGTKDGKPRRLPFPWLLIIAMFFFVPPAIFGGCLLLSPSIDNSKDNTINIAFLLEIGSIGLALIMVLINIVVSLWRKWE